MIGEARRQAGWKGLRSIPFFGPIRVALLLDISGKPFRSEASGSSRHTLA